MAERDELGNRHLAWIAAWAFIGVIGLGVAVPAALTAGHAPEFWWLSGVMGAVVVFAVYMVLTPFIHKWPFTTERPKAAPDESVAPTFASRVRRFVLWLKARRHGPADAAQIVLPAQDRAELQRSRAGLSPEVRDMLEYSDYVRQEAAEAIRKALQAVEEEKKNPSPASANEGYNVLSIRTKPKSDQLAVIDSEPAYNQKVWCSADLLVHNPSDRTIEIVDVVAESAPFNAGFWRTYGVMDTQATFKVFHDSGDTSHVVEPDERVVVSLEFFFFLDLRDANLDVLEAKLRVALYDQRNKSHDTIVFIRTPRVRRSEEG